MKWKPKACAAGDMIRVQLGAIWHYGVFVSEDEVIQFGHPVLNRRWLDDPDKIRVISTDIAAFASGNMVEVACFGIAERLKRVPPEKTVALARSRMGESGYDLLHNNCEHFATECVLGDRKCEQTERYVEMWNHRQVLDVYLSNVADADTSGPIFPPERLAQIVDTTAPKLKAQRIAVWKTLEYALLRSFNLHMADIGIRRTPSGKWESDRAYFSLSHSGDWVAVAVSESPVGIDIEETIHFLENDGVRRLASKVYGPDEVADDSPEAIMRAWVIKESCFKRDGGESFVPANVSMTAKDVRYGTDLADGQIALAVCGRSVANLRIYIRRGDKTVRVEGSELLSQ
ncbi:MAG: lecithin retinol acyltransferase family protein [Clostridia bacterium]|nr:lecithin retinol acyltransferase family protein [Clostridia bacterium]